MSVVNQRLLRRSLYFRRKGAIDKRKGYAHFANRNDLVVGPVNQQYPKKVIRYAYFLFVFSLPFEEGIGGLFLIGVVLTALTLLQPQLFLKPAPKAFWYFAMYLLVLGVLGLVTILDGPGDVELQGRIIRTLFKVGKLLVLFLIVYRMMMFEQIAMATLLTLAAACVVLAILQAVGVTTTEEGRVGHERISAFDSNPNVLAGVLSMGLLGLVGLAYGRKQIIAKVRLLAWLSSGFLLISIVRTGSRGALIALMLALIALTVKPSMIAERFKTILIASLVIISLALASYQIDAVRERWEKTYYEGDVAGRQVHVPIAWAMFLEKPIFGRGPVVHSEEMGARTLHQVGDPHNVYLWLLLETGVVGTVPFLMGLWLCWRSVWRARSGVHGPLPLALLLFFLVVNLKATYLYFTMFWFVLAYAAAVSGHPFSSSGIRFQTYPVKKQIYVRRPLGVNHRRLGPIPLG